MTGENVTVQNIFDKDFGKKPYGGGTREGGKARQGPFRPCPAPIRSIPEIFIKNILHSDIFPGHSSYLMTLVLTWECFISGKY